MKFISWNVNGFRACLEKGFGEFFEGQNADFVCLQETKMQQGQADFAPEGYFQYWYSAEKKGYSGTAVFCKKEPLSVILETFENGEYTAHSDSFLEVKVAAENGLQGEMCQVIPESHSGGVIRAKMI